MVLKQSPAQLKTADIRQSDIENRHIRTLMTRFLQRGQPALKGFHAKPFLLEHINQGIRNTLLIFHQPDRHLLHNASLLFAPRHDRYRANGIFWRPIDHLVGIGQISQRVAFGIIEAHDL
ncbi:hypothetical protein SDC9_190610 [bioreactor metagenome]|uniref:Uncharacterized protein n=1 Tax=bioreactor metagenome TaxID=1076179 RepID=A0A645HVG3_9ZZZZ